MEDFCHAPILSEKLVCHFISEIGPLVFLSDKQKSFIRGKSVISSEMLVRALLAASVQQVVLYTYGMKPCGVSSLEKMCIPLNAVAPCCWDVGIEIYLEGAGIPLFAIEKCVAKRNMYPMMSYEEGSIEIKMINANSVLIVYPKLLLYLKALSCLQIPVKVISLRQKDDCSEKPIKGYES